MGEKALRNVLGLRCRMPSSTNEGVERIPIPAAEFGESFVSPIGVGIAGPGNQTPMTRRERSDRMSGRHRRTPETEYASQTFAKVIIFKSITSTGQARFVQVSSTVVGRSVARKSVCAT